MFTEYQSKSLSLLGVNPFAINNSVTAVNHYNIRVVFVLSIHSDTSIFN